MACGSGYLRTSPSNHVATHHQACATAAAEHVSTSNGATEPIPAPDYSAWMAARQTDNAEYAAQRYNVQLLFGVHAQVSFLLVFFFL